MAITDKKYSQDIPAGSFGGNTAVPVTEPTNLHKYNVGTHPQQEEVWLDYIYETSANNNNYNWHIDANVTYRDFPTKKGLPNGPHGTNGDVSNTTITYRLRRQTDQRYLVEVPYNESKQPIPTTSKFETKSFNTKRFAIWTALHRDMKSFSDLYGATVTGTLRDYGLIMKRAKEALFFEAIVKDANITLSRKKDKTAATSVAESGENISWNLLLKVRKKFLDNTVASAGYSPNGTSFTTTDEHDPVSGWGGRAPGNYRVMLDTDAVQTLTLNNKFFNDNIKNTLNPAMDNQYRNIELNEWFGFIFDKTGQTNRFNIGSTTDANAKRRGALVLGGAGSYEDSPIIGVGMFGSMNNVETFHNQYKPGDNVNDIFGWITEAFGMMFVAAFKVTDPSKVELVVYDANESQSEDNA